MLKLIGGFLLTAALCSSAGAQTAVYEISKGSASVYNVSISTNSGAVRVDSPTASRAVPGRITIEVYNDDDSDVLRCAFTVDVSTVSGNANLGREIRPNTGVSWKIPPHIPVYCRVEGTDAAPQTATAIITQL